MNSTHKVETLEISDNDLDNVSGGLLGHIVGNVLGTVTGTVDSVVPVSGAPGLGHRSRSRVSETAACEPPNLLVPGLTADSLQ